ncbi:MAG: AraC family transcriptional regulator, partial [Bacteroides sp.]|nr:AraC family transcriptional regulator [Bacteroides sp.]
STSSKDHKLIYVYSGQIILSDNGKETVINKGECVFLRKNIHVTMWKQPKDGEQFKTIYMLFDRNFLRRIYQEINKDNLPLVAVRKIETVVKLPERPEITSLFHSIIPYFDSTIQPSEEIIDLKIREAIYFLLSIDRNFYPCLFDFTEPWKVDILDFLNENYRYDLSMEEIAGFTGRSLATFKRDFKKISSLTPRKWIINKRLEAARKEIAKGRKKIQDICYDVGFKNVSHFSRVYKEVYGKAPTQVS